MTDHGPYILIKKHLPEVTNVHYSISVIITIAFLEICYVLCIYLFLYISTIKANNLALQSNCSTKLKPLLDIISVQVRIAQPIAEEEQLPVEHVTPSLDVIPCDLVHFREHTKEDHHRYGMEADKHLINPELIIDTGCGCSYVQPQKWKPDEWTNFTEDKLQQ